MAVFWIIPAIAQSESLGKFATNGLGSYVLEKPWIGEERQTVATGFYATNREPADMRAFERITRLDLLCVSRDPFSKNQTNWALGQKYELKTDGWSHVKSHTYRAHLPSDSEIKACTSALRIDDLLGHPYFADGAPYNAHWSFFTLGNSNTIETLTVSCMSWDENALESLRVKRGVLTNDATGSKPK